MAEPTKRQETSSQERDDQSITSLVAHHAKSLVQEQVARRAGKPATDLGKLAKALHLTSEQLEGNLASPYVSKVAARLEQASELLENAKAKDALRSMERYAREQPLLFIGGAAILGFAGARFLKSTAAGPGDAESATDDAERRKSRNNRQGQSAARRA